MKHYELKYKRVIHAFIVHCKMETGMALLVVCFLAFISKSVSIEQESTKRQMEGLREEVRNFTQRLQKMNTTLQKGRIKFECNVENMVVL